MKNYSEVNDNESTPCIKVHGMQPEWIQIKKGVSLRIPWQSSD